MSRLLDAIKKLEEEKKPINSIFNKNQTKTYKRRHKKPLYLSAFLLVILLVGTSIFIYNPRTKSINSTNTNTNITKKHTPEKSIEKRENNKTTKAKKREKEAKKRVIAKKEKHKAKKIKQNEFYKKDKNNKTLTKNKRSIFEKENKSALIMAEEHRKKGEYQKAIHYYKIALNKETKNKAYILNNIGTLYLIQNKPNLALPYLLKAFKINKEKTITKNLIIAYLKTGQKEEACRILKEEATLQNLKKQLGCQ